MNFFRSLFPRKRTLTPPISPTLEFVRGKIVKDDRLHLRRLGTEYGGWTFVESPSLSHSVLISCGAGEDISFDLEMIRAYGCRAIIVDPTPRAITHFNHLVEATARGEKLGINGSTAVFYDSDSDSLDKIKWVEKAVWNRTGEKLRFFVPRNPTHVSHSLVNLQGTDSSIEVETITLSDLIDQAGKVALVKMDIEGAEIEALGDLLASGHRPEQLLIEFDQLPLETEESRRRVEGTINSLEANGYLLRHFDGRTNCLFVHRSF